MQTPTWLSDTVVRIEDAEQLDALDPPLDGIASRLSNGELGPVLRGEWLGHALHPLLTDFPLGCWIGAGLLDLVGGSRSRRAAQRLVGLGVLAVPATAAAGLVDWSTIGDRRPRRVGIVHAVGNGVATALYAASWNCRRRGRHVRGVLLALLGGGMAWFTGYLGGHLSFALGIGVGRRGLPAAANAGPDEGQARQDELSIAAATS